MKNFSIVLISVISQISFAADRLSFPLPNAYQLSDCYGKLQVLPTDQDPTGKGTREVPHPVVFQSQDTKNPLVFWEGKFYALTETKSDLGALGNSIPWMINRIEKFKNTKFSTSEVGSEHAIADAIRTCEFAAGEAKFSANPKVAGAADKLVNEVLASMKTNNAAALSRAKPNRNH